MGLVVAGGLLGATSPSLLAAYADPGRPPPTIEPTIDVAAGEHVARQHCGGCHAVGDGPSPFRVAPPFRDLHNRYPVGGLGQILQEGMIQPAARPEEGSPRLHPRMPAADLGPDEIEELTAYLRTLETPSGGDGGPG